MEDHLSSSQVQTQAETPLPNIGFNRRRLLWIGVLAVATLSLLLLLGDAPTTLDTVIHADWRLIGLATLIHYSGFAVRGHRWQLLLRASGYRLGYLHVTSVLLGGWFVSALLPVRLGEVFRIAALKLPPKPTKPAVPVADSLSSIILERTLDISALLILSASFGYLALGANLPNWVTASYIAALLLLLAVAAALLLAPGIVGRIRTWSSNRWWIASVDFVQQTVAALRTLPAHPRIALSTIGESLYIWLCDALLLWLVLAGVGIRMPFANAGFVALTVDISAAVPLTPGGLGQIEAVFSALLALLALAPTGISAAVLVTRAISYWSFLVFSGIVTFAAGLGSVFSRRQTAAPAASATKADVES
jgi:uncharacterized protein (TIRG00374 family)